MTEQRDYEGKYLPMACPGCDRLRLMGTIRVEADNAFVVDGSIECEKCGWKPDFG